MTTSSPRPIVLIIDDEQVLLRVIVRMLAPHFDVLAYERASDALSYLQSGAPCDAILCDVGLRFDDMTGKAFYERLKQVRPELALKVIFMTGSDATPEAEAILEQHQGRVLLKPFGTGELIAMLLTLLGMDTGAGQQVKADP